VKYTNIAVMKLFKMPNEIISISILIQTAMNMTTDTYPTWQTETYIWRTQGAAGKTKQPTFLLHVFLVSFRHTHEYIYIYLSKLVLF
jgi:hypothetical protein